MAISDVYTEKHENLIDRLKSINALFLQRDSSVIERYAGIAELALYKDMQKVGVLTLGLLDTNPQVRTLAAHVLARSYGMEETSDSVLKLLENEEEGLQAVLRNHEQSDFHALLRAIEKLLARPRVLTLDGAVIDYDRRHVLAILEGLGRRLRKHPEASNQQRHPLKSMLEEKENRWILPRIFAALDRSKDVYCRRVAMRVIGELDLECEKETPTGKETLPAFELICEAIDREENRDDYLVTRDGLKALLSLTQQYATAAQKERFSQMLRAFFQGRDYPALDLETGLQHSYLTRFNCIEIVQELGDFSLFKQLLAAGEEHGFFSLMKSTSSLRGVVLSGRVRRAISLTKEGVIQALLHFYLVADQHASETISEQQREIVDMVTTWIGSQDREVAGRAIAFFKNLPGTVHALRYLLESARANATSIGELLEPQQAEPQALPGKRGSHVPLKELLEDRKEFIIALGALFSHAAVSRADLVELRQEGIQLLRAWGLQNIPPLSEQVSKAARNARLEALWTLYDLTQEEPGKESAGRAALLSLEDVVSMLKEESSVPLRVVLELLHACVSDDRLAQLGRIVANQHEDPLVCCCAEIEQIMLTRGKRGDLSAESARLIPGQLGHTEGIHLRLATRFLPVLSQMTGPQASALIDALLKDSRLAASLRALLLERLSDYQCQEHYEFLQQTLWRTLQKRYPDRQQLRLSYLNLLRAGKFHIAARADEDAERYINNERYTPLQKQIVQALFDINDRFEDALSPVLVSEGTEQVMSLDSSTSADLHTFLYMASDTRDHRPAIRSYVRKHSFPRQTLVFLQKALTDTEIARHLYHSLPNLTVDPAGNETATKLPRPVVGRITTVTGEGAFVDIGLGHLCPFVRKEHLSTPDAPIEDWQDYAREITSTLLLFTIQRITFQKSASALSIREIELRRKSGGQEVDDELAPGVAEHALQAQVVAVDREQKRVIFQARGRNIAVALEDLSWNTTPEWIEQGWQRYFHQRSGQTFELTWRDHAWSLKTCQPYAEYFSQLIYNKGLSPFSLVYVTRGESGHIFEIEPGHFCSIPAERLLDRRAQALAQELQPVFLLPSRTLGSGDVLQVSFKEETIEGHGELVLQVSRIDEDKLTNNRLRPGMKFTGKLVDLKRAQCCGTLEVEALKDFAVTITRLPLDDPFFSQSLEDDCDISGRIVQVHAKNRSILMEYALAMPDELKEQEYYLCRVSSTPAPGDYRLLVHYANIHGELREAEMTYGHTSVVTGYRKGDVIPARLVQKRRDRRFSRMIRPRQYERLVAAVGLEQPGVWTGDIIRRQSDTLTIEQEGGSICEINVSDLELSAEEQRSIRAGNRIQLTRDQQANLHVSLATSYAIFSLLPRLEKRSEWTRFDQLAETTLSAYFPVAHPRDCIYVATVGSMLLLEPQPGTLIALPALSLVACDDLRLDTAQECYQLALHKQRDQLYFQTPRARFLHPLATGDLLTVVRSEGRSELQLTHFRAGPLHLAAEPWLAEQPVEQKMTMTAAVIRTQTRYENGVLVEIKRIGDQPVQLRSGLTSFYNSSKMASPDRQLFEEQQLLPGQEVQLLLEYPPQLRDGRLRLMIRGQATGTHSPQPGLKGQPFDPLPYLRELQPGHTLNGSLLTYDKEEGAFLVSLDDLQNADQDRYDCWLDADLVSFSQVSSYLTVTSLKEARVQTFTVTSVEIDGEYATVEVSLKDNPLLDVDVAGELYEWADGQLLRHATYIGPLSTQPGQAGRESEAAEQVPQEAGLAGPGEQVAGVSVTLEIVPGLLVSIAAGAFFIDGLSSRDLHRQSHLQTGDQLTLRVIREDGRYSLDVVASQQAERNVLGNPRRVIYGSVGARDGEHFPLKLEGYHRTRCLLDPDVLSDIEEEKLASYDLFRFTRQSPENNALYFRPLRVSQLKQGDLLHVQYRPPASDQSDRAIVLFGNQHTGYLRQRDISYQTGFNIHTFEPPADRTSFEARILGIQPDAHLIFFSLKGIPARQLDYFLDHRNDQRFSGIFPTTLVGFSARNDALDIELEPGIVIRLPLCRLSVDRALGLTAYDLKARLLPGDVLQFRLVLQPSGVVSLALTGILKSLLHYLHQGMLVRASLEEQRGYSGYQWIFSLPDYGNRRGELATASSIDFFPGVLHEQLQFIVQHIPADPNAPVRLRQRNNRDAQLVVRVESVEVDTIHICKEDGHRADIYSRYATYRVDDRISYLARTLPPSSVITVTRTTNQRGEILFSLLDNPLAPFAFLPAYLERRQLQSLELTYVRSEGQDHVFELEPGTLLLIPGTALFFYDSPLHDLQRFLPGDVFSARVERRAQSTVEEVRVIVQSLHLCVLHHWQPEQYFHAQVIETYPRSGGIMVKAGPLETFLSERGGLLPQHTANTFSKNDLLWVKIAQIAATRSEIRLVETPPPSRKRLMMAAGEKRRNPVLAGKIRSAGSQQRSLEVEVLGETLTLQPRDLAWSHAATAREVLLPGERELWVQLSFEGNRLCADARSFLAAHVARHLKPGTLVQAYVEKINLDQAEAPGKVLVNVDGVRTLVAGRDLVWGLPPSLVGVKAGTWLTVRVVAPEQSLARAAHQPCLSVSGRAVGSELEEMQPGSAFQATVRYTLPHGLVFTYRGIPGYISNQDLAWSENACAEELFEEGAPVTVYKVPLPASTPPFAFSLKHRSQLEGLKGEEAIHATVYRVTEHQVCVQTADLPANFFVLFSQHQPDFAYLRSLEVGACVQIQPGEGVQLSRLVAPFLLKGSAGESDPLNPGGEEMGQTLERTHAGAVTRFISILYAGGLLDKIKQPLAASQMETLLTQILEALTQCALPCTCYTLRILLGKLDQSHALQGFWEVLARHRLDENDGEMLTVLCRVAQGLKGIETGSNPPRALLAQIYYAQGMTALLPGNAGTIAYEQALEWLLLGYTQSQHVEIMLALVLVYGKLQAFQRVQEFLDLLVAHFCQNLHLLLHLPEPQDMYRSAYAHLRAMVPGLNMSLDDFATEVQRTVHDNFTQGRVSAAAEYLRSAIARLRAREVEMPELFLNLALCYTYAARFAAAQACLDDVRRLLEKGENRKRFFRLRLPYAQLRMFLYYQQRNFARIQRFIVEEIEQELYLWERTCFPAYLFLAAGKRAVSQACIEAVPLRPDSQPERVVLYLYWHRAEYVEGLQRLQDQLFGRLYKDAGNWEQRSAVVQVLPDLARTGQFKEIVRLCYEYDAPLYALTRYREMPSLLGSIGDLTVATQLVNLALRSARVEEARQLALAYFERQEQTHPMEAARFMTWFYSSLLLSTDLREFSLARQKPAWNEIFKQALSELARPDDLAASGVQLAKEEYAINRILDHWLKSPSHRQHCGLLLAQILKKNAVLAARYWKAPVLRRRLWQVFACSHDYGTLLEILPGPQTLTLEMLEDITFHLYLLRLHHRASTLLQDACELVDRDEKSARYIGLLQKLGEKEVGPEFDHTLNYLLQRPARRQLALFLDCRERQVAIEALEFLVQSPCAPDLVEMQFLLAELLELEQQDERASRVYRALLLDRERITPVQYALAAIHLLRLHTLDQSLPGPADLFDERLLQEKEGAAYQLLADLFALGRHLSSGQDRTNFILMLGRLQLALAAVEREEITRSPHRKLFLSQVAALLHALSVLPRAHRCFVSLYRVLIGTEALKDWQVEDMVAVFVLFFDASLFLNFDCDLERTMNATCAHFAALAAAGSRQDQQRSATLEQAQRELLRIDFWLAPRRLKEHPDQVAETARIVRSFLHGAQRFSAALLSEATLALMGEADPAAPGDADSRWLLTRALLAQGEIERALQQVYSERNPDKRDELLLEIFFDRLTSRDFQRIRPLLPQFTARTLRDVESLLKAWENPEARQSTGRDLFYLVSKGQRQLLLQYIHLSPASSLGRLKDEVLYALIVDFSQSSSREEQAALLPSLSPLLAASSERDPFLVEQLLGEMTLMQLPCGQRLLAQSR